MMVTYWLVGESKNTNSRRAVEERRTNPAQDKSEKLMRNETTQAANIKDSSSQTSKVNVNGRVLNDMSSAGCEDESALPLLSISPAENYTHV